MHWLVHAAGLDVPPNAWFDFWQGIGADAGEFAIVGALLALIRKHNCAVHGCWRLGRHATPAGHMVCRRHHPDGPLTAENVK